MVYNTENGASLPKLPDKSQILGKRQWILLLEINLKKNFMALFHGWGSTASRLKPLQGGSLILTSKFPENPGTHFINLREMKG